MTREERDKAIRILQWLHDNKFLFRSTEEDVKYATKLAIQVLLQELSGDAVSRKQALSSAKYIYESDSKMKAFSMIKMLEELPPVKLQESKWIPVSEKLPSDCNEDWVLAQIQEDNGYLWIPCVAEYRKDTDDWYSDANDIGWLKNHRGFFKVIAWMPLPEPYKVEPQESEVSE